MSAFDTCLPYVLAEECPDPSNWSDPRNFSNDRHDKGGATMCGIIQREYDHYRKFNGSPTRPVLLCTKAEGYTIYKMWYWDPHCDGLAQGLNLSFFDACVNEGSTEAIRILQVALGEPNDGMWGPMTAAAAGRTPVAAAVTRFFTRRMAVYKEIVERSPSQKVFLKGWERRATTIYNQSTLMING